MGPGLGTSPGEASGRERRRGQRIGRKRRGNYLPGRGWRGAPFLSESWRKGDAGTSEPPARTASAAGRVVCPGGGAAGAGQEMGTPVGGRGGLVGGSPGAERTRGWAVAPAGALSEADSPGLGAVHAKG